MQTKLCFIKVAKLDARVQDPFSEINPVTYNG